MLTRRSGRGALLLASAATLVTVAATGAFAAVGRMLAGPGRPATASVAADRAAVEVRATQPVVPDPPWASQLPPGTAYPIWTDQTNCWYRGVKINCKDPSGTAFLNPLDNCYWKAENPQPKPGAAVWLGLSIAYGKVYDVQCVVGLDAQLLPVLGPVRAQFSAKTPPGTMTGEAKGTAIALAASLTLTGILAPDMGLQPQSAGTRQAAIDADKNNSTAGLVGLPTWYWSTANLLTAGPVVLNVPLIGLLNLQASLLGQRLEWDTGDNGNVVVCAKVGTAFTAKQAGTTPACGYTYAKPGTYAVSARSVWFLGVSVSVPPLAGTVLIVRSALPRFIKIDELQVVTE